MTGRRIVRVLVSLEAVVIAAGAAVIVWPGAATTSLSSVREIVHMRDDSVMVIVPGSDFLRGSADAHPDLPDDPPGGVLEPHQVLLARAEPGWRHADEHPARWLDVPSFAIDRHEVTNGQYRRFLDSIATTRDHGRCHPEEPADKDHTPRYWREFNPLLRDSEYSRTTPFSVDTFSRDETPVVGVDWFDAFAYAAWAGKRLPTEAEWELAARGTDGRRWPWGDEWRWGLANVGGEKKGRDVAATGYEKDGYIYPAPVGSYPDGRSPYGIDDMAGNVAEWCADRYAPDAYSTSSPHNPRGPTTGTTRVVRGGSSRSAPSSVRATARTHHEPEYRSFTLGFRTAKGV